MVKNHIQVHFMNIKRSNFLSFNVGFGPHTYLYIKFLSTRYMSTPYKYSFCLTKTIHQVSSIFQSAYSFIWYIGSGIYNSNNKSSPNTYINIYLCQHFTTYPNPMSNSIQPFQFSMLKRIF